MSRAEATALIFEGGGMRAALTSGFAVTLIQEGIAFPWVAGISAGASNGANYLSGDVRRARRSFVEFSADPQFGSLRTFAAGRGLFNAEYIYQRTALPTQALPFDWEAFTGNPAEFAISAFDVESGAEQVWTKADFPTMDDLMVRVRATSTMPVIMPPVEVAGRTYVDGALGADGGIPLSAARRAGFERFAIVLTQQRDYVKAPQRFPAFYRAYFRRHPAVAEALLTRWRRYNALREEVFALERAGRAYVFAPEVMPLRNGTRNLSQLAAAHRLGLSQARRELPALREFLGLA
ncbi:patatin-like phospholipase family protein [Brevibacterium rongguiense]|nr:patatin family protein [Brevibacterium rongguiense]